MQNTFWQLPEEWEVQGLREKGDGIRSTNWQLQNSHRDIKYSIRNIVNNTEICMVSDGHQIYQGDHVISYINLWSLGCTPETNIILYIKKNF